jgi:acetyltransferase EpsM
MSKPITIPLLNPNEPEAILVGLHIHAGQQVAKGDALCTLETTKSASDLLAENDGFVVGLRFQQGDTVRAGELLCYLAETPDWQPPIENEPPAEKSQLSPGELANPDTAAAPPHGLRITQPALTLARQAGLDLNHLPQDRLVTESLVRELLETALDMQSPSIISSAFDPTAIIVYGGGGHGKALIDLLRALNVYRIVGILDDGISAGENILGVPVLGGAAALVGLYAQGVRLAVNAVGGIGNIAIRVQVFEKLAAAGFACPAVVHPIAFVEPSASLSPGAQVFPHAYVGSAARVGFGCIVNTGAIVSHDCLLDDYANISPGAILAGEVQIGASALVGMGVTINLRVKVGSAARLGNGSTVISDVPARGVVRAGTTWPE